MRRRFALRRDAGRHRRTAGQAAGRHNRLPTTDSHAAATDRDPPARIIRRRQDQRDAAKPAATQASPAKPRMPRLPTAQRRRKSTDGRAANAMRARMTVPPTTMTAPRPDGTAHSRQLHAAASAAAASCHSRRAARSRRPGDGAGPGRRRPQPQPPRQRPPMTMAIPAPMPQRNVGSGRRQPRKGISNRPRRAVSRRAKPGIPDVAGAGRRQRRQPQAG